jgi:hypothetical protein
MNDLGDAPQLRTFRRQYFQLVELQNLRWPDVRTLKLPKVQSWLFTDFFDTTTIATLPPDRYQLRVLKLLISKLESSITDPEEDVWPPISSL